MSLGRTTLSALFRFVAAVALVVFVAAQAMCFAHCHFGGGREDQAQPSCHASSRTTASRDVQDQPAPTAPATTPACSALKTMLITDDAGTLVAQPLTSLYILGAVFPTLIVTETQAEAAFSRQARPRDWVFTPLVCLGPAFRSLAPPLVA